MVIVATPDRYFNLYALRWRWHCSEYTRFLFCLVSIHNLLAEADIQDPDIIVVEKTFQSTAPSQKLTANISIFFILFQLHLYKLYNISSNHTIRRFLLFIYSQNLPNKSGANPPYISCSLGIRTCTSTASPCSFKISSPPCCMAYQIRLFPDCNNPGSAQVFFHHRRDI